MSAAAAQTAIGPMVIVAADQHEPAPLVHDPWAARLLPPAGRLAAELSRWRPVRAALKSATDRRMAGGWASILCRKRYIDDQVIAAVAEGVEAVVILGAGYDTRAYRISELAGIPVCEVDLPTNCAGKAAALRRTFGGIPPHVTLAAVDFETDDLATCLERAGFGRQRRTCYVWEAVTQYLTEPSARTTLECLSGAVTGSLLVFTFVRDDFLTGQRMYGAENAYRRFVAESPATKPLWRFGLSPERVAPFLAEYGWQEREQVGPSQYVQRYLAPAGRSATVSEIERAVLAVRVG
ncbi:SAM-dependent methyltransferase [Mycolicibacterium litorale]|nr:SAM-dependent methyltransferase [Mycolicibacterium litorale]